MMAMRIASIFLVLSMASASSFAASQQETQLAAANPVRKVVTMLQAMVKKVTDEGEKEKELYEKYMCYCKSSGGDLQKAISDSTVKIPQVESDIKEAEAQIAQLKEDIENAKADRTSAKEAMAEATALREKEAAAFAELEGEDKANIAAINAAVKALEKGISGTFLQTRTAQVLKKWVSTSQDMLDSDRQEVLAFLSGGQDSEYVPASGEVVGILKTMADEMNKSLAEATEAENAAIKAYEALMAAKKKQVDALSKEIEEKMTRSGSLAVRIAEMKNDLTDEEQSLLEDKEFLAELEKGCETQTAEWDEIVKTRAEELVALQETIKVLNDDDALELFKKTLPSASSSFVQVASSTAAVRSKALAILKKAKRLPQNVAHLDLIMLALHGKKIGFDKVIAMIDQMVATLKSEQKDDDNKKEYCATQFDETDDKKKDLEKSVSDLETMIAETEQGIETTAGEISALNDKIKDLDKSVAEATENRKAEHEEFNDLMSSDSTAKELLNFAKNRLNKFYNPKLYKAPPKQVLSEEDQMYTSFGGEVTTAAPGGIAGTGIGFFQVSSKKDAPPPPPEAPGAYQKKSQETTGVIAMIDLLIKDLAKEMTEAETREKNAQEDYEGFMKDSAAMRAADSSSLTEKTATKASMEGDLERAKEDKTSAEQELSATMSYLSSLHAECDWLMKYFDARQEARASEIDALGKAKAVLSGADYSLLQTKQRKFLRH